MIKEINQSLKNQYQEFTYIKRPISHINLISDKNRWNGQFIDEKISVTEAVTKHRKRHFPANLVRCT